MQAKAKLFGHSVHQMLIVFPLGLLATSLIFDFIYLGTKNGRIGDASFWMVSAGIIGALAAAVFGAADWIGIPANTRAKAIGLWHGIGNVVVVLLFIASWAMRRHSPLGPTGGAIFLSALGVALVLVTGWLGGELVDRLGVGVDEGAHVNAPSSLSGRAASEVDATYVPSAKGPSKPAAVPGRSAMGGSDRATESEDRKTGQDTRPNRESSAS